MKVARILRQEAGITLGEIMIVLAITGMMVTATLSASIALQKSLSASDKFFANQIQQVRIIDYLTRDVKRATVVTTAPDKKTVTCTVPNYVIRAEDSETALAATNEGVRRVPVVTITVGGPQIDYGRRMANAALVKNSATITCPGANFTAADVGASIWGAGLTRGTTITARNSANSITVAPAARLTLNPSTITWAQNSTVVYALNNQTIERRENGVITTIASSADQLIPETVDVEQANTEYTSTLVNFLPVYNFNSGGGGSPSQQAAEAAKRQGTTVFGKAYLRNRRRG